MCTHISCKEANIRKYLFLKNALAVLAFLIENKIKFIPADLSMKFNKAHVLCLLAKNSSIE